MTLLLNLTLLLIFISFLSFLIKLDLKIVFLFGLLVFQAITIIPSLIYIEEGILISEQGRESYFVGATLAYVIYFMITFIIIFLTFNTLKKYKPTILVFKIEKKPVDSKIIYYLAVLALAILFFNASQSKLPLLDPSITRFSYWENSKYPFLNKILGNTAIFIPFILGILFKNNKVKSILILILYFAYNFLIGQKFSPIVSGLFSFLLPIILISEKKINFKMFFKKKFIVSFLVIFGIAYAVIYKRYEQRSPYAVIKIYDPNEAMFYRVFGLQGHLMWGSVETYIYNDEEHSYKPSELLQGMHHLMYRFAANQKGLEESLEKGFSFTNGYPSILFKIFPLWLALFVHIFLLITMLAFTGWLLYEFIKQKAYVMAVVTYQLFNWTIYAFTMGYLYKLKYTILFLVFYSIFVVLNNRVKIMKKIKTV